MPLSEPVPHISHAINGSLSGRTHIIWDLDGVHYDFNVATRAGASFYDMCVEAIAVTAVNSLGKDNLSYDDATSLAEKSLKEHNDQITGFMPLIEEMQFDKLDFKTEMLHGFCDVLFELVQEKCPKIFHPDKETTKHFLKSMGDVKHAILTHACATRWAKPVLQLMHRIDFFRPDHILGFEDFDFHAKSLSAKAVTQALTVIGADAGQTIFVEDSAKHLQVAKQAHPELMTILICAEPPKEPMEGIDFYAILNAEILEAVNQAKHQYGVNLQMLRNPLKPACQ